MSEAALATSVPDPMAIPMSARFSAGASLTPSRSLQQRGLLLEVGYQMSLMVSVQLSIVILNYSKYHVDPLIKSNSAPVIDTFLSTLMPSNKPIFFPTVSWSIDYPR